MDLTFNDVINLGPHNYFYDVSGQLKSYVYRRSEEAFKKGDAVRDSIKTKAQISARQKWIRKAFIESIGGLPENSKSLDAQVTAVIEEDGFRIEKVIFQSRQNCYVTANVYVPNHAQKQCPAILFVCGHHERAKHEPEYQIVCRYLVQAGFVVLAHDPIGQGERFSYYEKDIKDTTIRWGTFEHDYSGSQCFMAGDSLARYFVHDSIRALDYLCSRPEVDPKRIGITGNSGGGTQTCMMMMADTRIAAAAPTTFLMSRQEYMYAGQAQDAEQLWPGLTASGWDHEDILLAMAPKPVCVLAVKYDFFPIEGTRDTVNRAKRFWKVLGKETCLDLVEDASRHTYTHKLAQAAAKFFAKHLIGKHIDPTKFAVETIDPKSLWCTKSGQIRADYKDAISVFDENKKRIEGSKKKLPSKIQSLKWLKQKVYADRVKCDLNARNYWSGNVEEFWVDAWMWRSQADLFNAGMVFKPLKYKDKNLPLTIAIFEDGTKEIDKNRQFIRWQCELGRSVLILELTAMGSLLPDPLVKGPKVKDLYGAIHKLNFDLMWIDDSIAAIRVYDIIRAFDFAKEYLSVENIKVFAQDRLSLYPNLAKLIDTRIKTVITEGISKPMDWVLNRYYNYDNIHSFIIPGILMYIPI